MNNQRQEVDMGFTSERFPEGIHMCMIYDNEKQRRKIVSEFLAAGLRHGEQVRYLVDTTTPEDVRSWMVEMGVEIPEDAPFNIFKAENVYCPNGRFDPQETLNGMVSRFELAKKAGYPRVRGSGEMSWALRAIPGSDRMVEFEALLNGIYDAYAYVGICQYDTRLFDGATLLKVLKVHPYMIAQGQILRNPYYMRPEEFLAELKVNP